MIIAESSKFLTFGAGLDGLRPVILHEQANKGRTIIEKFEQHAVPCAFAVVLLTPDDHGGAAKSNAELRSRARQNVILELGYFVGKLGRHKVAARERSGPVHDEPVELARGSARVQQAITPFDSGAVEAGRVVQRADSRSG